MNPVSFATFPSSSTETKPVSSLRRFFSSRLPRPSGALVALFCVLSILLTGMTSVAASDEENGIERSVQVFMGQYSKGNTGESWNPFEAEHEDNYLIALSYGQDFWRLGKGFYLGTELGTAYRGGEDSGTAEIWIGPRIHHTGFSLGKTIRCSFYCSTGISWVSGAIGTEAERVLRRGGDSEWLFYLGPELSFCLQRCPEWEVFYRLHHRSGADSTLGGLTEGHNANTVGIRRKF